MLNELSNKLFKRYTNIEWLLMKISIAALWIHITKRIFIDTSTVLYPVGLCRFFDCSLFTTPYTKHYLVSIAVVLCILYLLEIGMKYTTLLMFLVSCVMFTLEESSGVLNRSALYSMIFLAQCFAYFIAGQDLKKNRIQFAVQIIAAGYFLAAVSKLIASGPGWVTDAPNAAIQMAKNYAYEYFNRDDIKYMNMGMTQANFILKYKPVVLTLFGLSLFFEATAWVATLSKRNAFIYGWLLLSMHLGIYYFMDIIIVAIFYPMLIILLNPLYLAYLLISQSLFWLSRKLGY